MALLLSQSMALDSLFILMLQIWVLFTSGVLRHSYFPRLSGTVSARYSPVLYGGCIF